MICKCVRCGIEFEAVRKTAVCKDCHVGVCVVCGKEFQLQTPWTQKTCSSKCRGVYRRESGIAEQAAAKVKKTMLEKYGVENASELQRFKKICKWCGKEFETTSARREYCEDKHYGPCPVCGKQVEIKEMYVGPQACSEECRLKRIQATCLEKYGSTTAVDSEHARDLAKQTCLEKYGVDHYSKSDEFKEKFRSTSMEKYGTSHPMQNKEIQEKALQTNLDRYGAVSPMCNDIVKAKARESALSNHGGFGFDSPELSSTIKETMKERYGVDTPIQSEEIRSKMCSTILHKYGVDNPLKSPEVREKGRQTSLERYGVEVPSQSAEIKQKVADTSMKRYGVSNVFKSEATKQIIHETLQARYGVDNPMQSEDIKNKAKSTNLERYGTEWYNSSKYAIERRMTDPSKIEEFESFKKDPKYFIESTYQTAPTLTQLARDTGVDLSTISYHVIQSHSQKLISYRKSTMEEDVCRYLRNKTPDIQISRNNRDIISPQEIDIYLPEYKIGFECNPTSTHNSSIADPWGGDPKSYTYHMKKSYQCLDKGIFLFHIFGYEWIHKHDIILSMIDNLLGLTSNITYGRNTHVVDVTHQDCIRFLDINHRQGQTSAKVRLGLIDNTTDELISMMTFNRMRSTMGKMQDDDNTWELSRFCNKLHTSVVGGASKLLKHFCEIYQPNKIVSFSDVAHTKGTLYETLGFNMISKSEPGYVWVNYADDTYLHRVQCQKQNLRHLFNEPELDIEHQTERDIMEAHGYVQVFDSGVVRWEKCFNC